MTPEEAKFIHAALAEASALMRAWPAGMVVWHRGSGQRMIVDGWKIAGDGKSVVSVSNGSGWNTFYPFELSRDPQGRDEEGEEWKRA